MCGRVWETRHKLPEASLADSPRMLHPRKLATHPAPRLFPKGVVMWAPCLADTQFDSQGEAGVCKQLRPREPLLPEVVGNPQIHVPRCRRGCLSPTV